MSVDQEAGLLRPDPAGNAQNETQPNAGAYQAPTAGRRFRRTASSSAVYMLGVLALLLIIFSTLAPVFFTAANMSNVVTDAATLLVMATGMTFVMIAAGFDLSIGSVLVFAGVCGAKKIGRAHV